MQVLRPVSSSKLPSKSPKKSLVSLIVVAVLALFVAVSALPRYFASWPWATPPSVPNQSALQAIRDEGISLPGWVVDEQIRTKLGGDTWSIQQLSKPGSAQIETSGTEPATTEPSTAEPSTIVLLLRPQVWHADQPEVEWLDVKGSQRWTTDSYQKLSFEVPSNQADNRSAVRIHSDFFRAWAGGQTYAIVQWYAWPTGGSASPARWFWVDQKSQWQRHQRLPWVAVSLWLPIDPLSAIAPHHATAEALGQAVQQTLLQTVFTESKAGLPAGGPQV